MAAYNLSTSGSTYVGAPVYAYVPNGSLGLSGLNLAMRRTRGLTTSGTTYVYPPGVYVSNGSIGLSGPTRINIVRSGIAQGSIGLSSSSVNAATNHSLLSKSSIGLTPKIFLPAMKWARAAKGSFGITGANRLARLYQPTATASLGITSNSALRLKYIRGAAKGSLGLSARVIPVYARRPKASGSIGLTALVYVSLKPAPSMGSIALIEIQDGPTVTTYGSAQSREYQNITKAVTISSYPKPFKLLN